MGDPSIHLNLRASLTSSPGLMTSTGLIRSRLHPKSNSAQTLICVSLLGFTRVTRIKNRFLFVLTCNFWPAVDWVCYLLMR